MNPSPLPRIVTAAACVLLFASVSFAAAPNLVNYQGRLTNSAGNPVADNSYAVTFSIYSGPSGGVALWTETQAVSTIGGIFSAVLGSTIPFSVGLFSDSTRYLGIKVGADPEISPRSRLTSVPYALGADNGWRDVGGAILQNNTYDFVGIGHTNPQRPLHVVEPSNYLFVSRMESSNSDATVTEISNTSSNAVWEASVAGSNGIPFWGIQPGDMYFYKQGTPWPNAVLTSSGSLGLGTSLPRARVEAVTLDTIAGLFLSAGATSATRVLRAEHTGTGNYDAVAVYGKSAPADYFGFGGMFEGGYTGVAGYVTQLGTNTYYGVSGKATGSGTGTKTGVTGIAFGENGLKYGVLGTASGTGGVKYGVYGYASGDHPNRAYGLYGVAAGNFAFGALVTATGPGSRGITALADGDASTVVYGTFTEATGTGGTKVGLFADARGGTTNWAGYFAANVNVIGTLSKSAGSFRIDHPLDPENKYLQHSFVESPDMMNIYNGNVVTDANGNATIVLPDYFAALNKDFRYQLTVIGQFAQAIVSSKVTNNQFSIRTDKPAVEVSWQVTGIRKDAYAEAHRIEVEVDKRSEERGKYAHPELFGKGREMGIGYRPEMERSESSSPTHPDEMEKLKAIKQK